MNVFDDFKFGMRELNYLFVQDEIKLEIRFIVNGQEAVHKVKCLQGKLSENDIKFLGDVDLYSLTKVTLQIEDLQKSIDLRTGRTNCITRNFKDSIIYLGNKKYSVYKEQDENGNLKNSVILVIKRFV